MQREQILKRLQRDLRHQRYVHTLGVEQMARSLARRTGEDVEAAGTAALLHDCAKCMDVAAMLAYIKRGHVKIDAITRKSPALLHAPAGMAMAKEVYGVRDARVLDAIRWHTTGKPGMSRLCCILYLADVAEPYRERYAGLDAIREVMRTDLSRALLLAVEDTIGYVQGKGKPVYPLSVQMRQWLQDGAKPLNDVTPQKGEGLLENTAD